MTFDEYKAAMIKRNAKLADPSAVLNMTVERFWQAQRQAWDQAESNRPTPTATYPGDTGIFGDLFR